MSQLLAVRQRTYFLLAASHKSRPDKFSIHVVVPDCCADGFARFVLVYVAVSWIIPVSLVFLVLQALSGFMVFLPTNAMILERVHERDLSNMQCAAHLSPLASLLVETHREEQECKRNNIR